MTVLDERWPFIGRDDDVASIAAVLDEESGRGVVLVGDPGVGKTMIAQQAVSRLSWHFDHIHLRGVAAHAATPYSALNVLLAELDEDTARSPLLVLSALERKFDNASVKRPTLMHLDGVEDIDELSATVIAHLARMGAVRLLVTCHDLLRAPGELFDLWKDGVLERFDIQPLSLAAAVEMLSTALGAPISRSAALELWSTSGGNPKYLQRAANADVLSGHLLCSDGTWVTRDVPRSHSGRLLTDWAAPELAALPPEDRAVVEVLAVAGRLPVDVLLRALPSDSLDTLQVSGMVTCDPADGPLLRLANGVFADAVRSQLPSAGGREALETVSALRDEPGVPVEARTALAAWALDQGADLDQAQLVTLAQLANDHGLEGAAERFLEAVPAAATGAARIEQARRLWMDGDPGRALETIGSLLTGDASDALPLEVWVGVRLLAARMVVRTQGREHEAEALLHDVVTRLQPEPAGADPIGLRTAAEIALLEVQVFEGELGLTRDRALEVLGASPQDERSRIRVRGILGVVEATLGAPLEAVAVGRTITPVLADPSFSTPDGERALAHAYGAMFLAGHWSECLRLTEDQGGGADGIRFGGSSAEFAEGVVLAYLGRSSEALGKLLPAISQFRTRDRHGLLPLAEAAAAYALVLEDAPDAAVDHLRAIDLTGHRSSWHLREAVRYFTLLAEAWLDTPDVIADVFIEHALELGGRGYHGVELFFLSQAVQLGRHDAAHQLGAAAAASSGPFARLCADFAAALAAQDPGALKEVARRAADAGNHTLAGDVAALSMQHLTDTDDPIVRVHAEQVLRRTSTPARRHIRQKLLSERERAIARKVAQGVPNKEIAREEHISPRTVEGHVHQIMSKLGLSSRKQLALIFGRRP